MKRIHRFCFMAFSAWLGGVPAAGALILPGDPADYEAQRQQFEASGTVTAVRGDHESLQLFSRDFGGFAMEEGRPIYQFDLSALDQPLASAVFSVELLSVDTNVDYAVEIWGSQSNLAGPLTAGESGSGGQFAASGYEPVREPGVFLADQGTALGRVFLDITGYLNDRYAEWANGGDSWAYLRLQSADTFALGSGVDATFTFASADHPNLAFQPSIETVAIPEPAHAALLTALAGAWLLWHRLRKVWSR